MDEYPERRAARRPFDERIVSEHDHEPGEFCIQEDAWTGSVAKSVRLFAEKLMERYARSKAALLHVTANLLFEIVILQPKPARQRGDTPCV